LGTNDPEIKIFEGGKKLINITLKIDKKKSGGNAMASISLGKAADIMEKPKVKKLR
jgi:hypothetical protein